MKKFIVSSILGLSLGLSLGAKADPLILYSFAATVASTSTTPTVRDVTRIRGQGVAFAITNSATNAMSYSLVAVSGTWVTVAGPITLVASQRLAGGASGHVNVTNYLYNDTVRLNMWLADGITNLSSTGILLMKQ